jgi:hypothetical protein
MHSHNPGHITRGDPVMRTRRLIQKDIELLQQQLDFIDDDYSRDCVITEIEELRLDLKAVMELEGV